MDLNRLLAIAAAVTLLVQVFRRAPWLSALWQRIPDGWRWLPAMVAGGVWTWAERLQGGALPAEAAAGAVGASVAIGLTAMGIHATAKESRELALLVIRLWVFVRRGGGGGALLLFGLLAGGCAGSFEESRLSSPRPAASRAPALSRRCEQLDDRRSLWGGVAKGGAVLAGGAGLATIPVESHRGRVGLAAGGVAAAAVAAAAVYVAEQAGASWVQEGCQ
jgi:hypothetical protein